MLPEIGATELLVIAVVALIVVGPKDLPLLLRKLGQFMARLRGMAAEFRSSFDEMARQSELDELRREVEAMRRMQSVDQSAIAAGEAHMAEIYDELGRGLSDATPPPIGDGMAPEPAALSSETPAQPEPAPKPRKPRASKAAETSTRAKSAGAAKPRASRTGKTP